MKRFLLEVAVLFFSIAVTSVFASNERENADIADSVNYRANPLYGVQTGLYDLYQTRKVKIVMLGNSITYGVNWAELLGRQDIVGRGIPGDIVKGFIGRLDYIYKLQPEYVFIMGGINDIYSGINTDTVFSSYTRLIETLRKKGIIPVIQSTLYVSPKWHDAQLKNPEVRKLNGMLQDYARKNKLIFIDLNARMSENLLLKDELTYDGVHLNARAYGIWKEELEKVLSDLGV